MVSNPPNAPQSPPSFELSALDRWVRRTTVATLIALAVGLVGLGVALYPPEADSAAPQAPKAAFDDSFPLNAPSNDSQPTGAPTR
jgi:hypothetical protein